MTEKQLQNEIVRVFGTRPDLRLWRQNTGVAVYAGRGPGDIRRVRFGVPGQADLTGILPGGVRLEIEVKGPHGRQSDDQRAYQQIIERFGGVYVLAYSLADVWAALKPYGIKQGSTP